jgi:hypothetical protein
VRFGVLTAVRMTMLFFWVVTPYRLVGGYHISEIHTVSILGAEDGGSMKMAVFWVVTPCSLVEVY